MTAKEMLNAATQSASTRIIESSVPSRWVLRSINPFVSMILRSPLHRLLSGRVLLLTFTGRKTWKRYTIPVGYTREGDTLTIFSSKSWFKNLRGGSPIVVHLKGSRRTGLAEAIEEREEVFGAAERLIAKYGLKGAGRRIGLALDIDPPPTSEERALALEGRVVIRIVLGQGNGADLG
jgi:F420H(2)-dependent quinone reductase